MHGRITNPLGVISKSDHDKIRLKNLDEAVIRYVKAGKEVPAAWIHERNNLIRTNNR